MQLEDKPLDPHESLRLIQSFITGSRRQFCRAGFAFIFWGILVAAAALMQYILIVFLPSRNNWWPWPVLTIGGALFTFIYQGRKTRKQEVITSYDHFFRWLFTCGCFTYFLFSFLCASEHVSPIPVMLGFTGFLVSVTGLVMRFKPLLWGGLVFLIASVAGVYLQPTSQLLLIAAAILLGYLVPGILLTRETKA